MTPQEWRELLTEWFLVPDYPSVYVLGSFARHVTLYSQQVRAFNLVTGLVETGEIVEGRDIVVVGGGAAGMTAAVAAARRKAKVVVLEKLEDLMELQGNNRQRWLHPYIYDWPDNPNKDETDLPFLNWKADSAESVARTITKEWEQLADLWNLDIRLNAEYVRISDVDHTIISWQDETQNKPHIKHGALIILAIGFGLEPTTEYGDSYWAEDDLDTRFRAASGERWLISGFGDGAFTDLIRLSFRRFRQGEIATLLENVNGIGDIKDQLKDMHNSASANAEELTKAFQKLALSDLIETLKPRVRRHGPKLFLVGKDQNAYGPNASVLNRLVVYALENMNAFTLLKGPVHVEGIQPGKNGGYDVPLDEGEVESFHRIILRHGPRPSALEKDFPRIFKACGVLRQRWENLPMREDKTRTKLWPDNFYGPSDAGATISDWIQKVTFDPFALTDRGVAVSYNKKIEFTGPDITTEKVETRVEIESPVEVHFAPGTSKFGVRASAVEVVKKVRNDGVSTLDYAIKQLEVLSGELKGVRFYYYAVVGQVGHPILDADAVRAGLRWEEDPQPDIETEDFDSTMAAMLKRVRKLAGTLLFEKVLTSADPPLSFGWSITTLATDALSVWEYNQLYSEAGLVHMNGDRLDRTEYFARMVWFPVETLKLSITLPSRTPGPAFPSYFLLDQNETIRVEDVIREQVLYIYPPYDYRAQLPADRWKKQAADTLVQSGQFTRVAPLTWELTVSGPMVGSCYSLDWRLPQRRIVENDPLESETSFWRRQLLQHRAGRLSGKGKSKVQKLVRDLARAIYARYGAAEPSENLTISILTYDEEYRRLQFVDGSLNGDEPSKEMWDLWLPYGTGLASACFRQQAHSPFIHFAPEEGETPIGPEPYLPLPGQIQHNVMLSFPLTHPHYDTPTDSSTFETVRLRIGVLDIGSDSPLTKLREFRESEMNENFQELIGWSKTFVENLVSVLRKDSVNANR